MEYVDSRYDTFQIRATDREGGQSFVQQLCVDYEEEAVELFNAYCVDNANDEGYTYELVHSIMTHSVGVILKQGEEY